MASFFVDCLVFSNATLHLCIRYIVIEYDKIRTNIEENKLSYSTGSVEDKVGLSATGVKIGNQGSTLIWAKNTNGTRIFSVSSDGYMYAKNGEIGNWRFGAKGLYSEGDGNISSYKTYNKETEKWEFPTLKRDDDQTPKGIYIGADGIRLGNTFHVDPSGSIYSISGSIGGCTINSEGIKGTGWYINHGGAAGFSNVKINGTSVVDLVGFTSKGGAGGGTTLGGGATINPGAGGVTVPNGKTLDSHITDDIINATYIGAKLAGMDTVNVKWLNAGEGLVIDGREFKKSDIKQIYDNEGAIANLEARVSALENKS